jgi:hypothetical protein
VYKLLVFLIFAIFFVFSVARAEDISLNGFLQGNYSANLGRANPSGDVYKWAEERIQLKLSADKDPLYLFIKGDASYDHIDEETDTELREGYVDYISDSWDLRIGRQIITWGVGDLIFINDVFPKDYEAFFSGRPLEYLKKGVDGVKIGMYPAYASVELVIIPFFEPDNYPVYPHSTRFWVFDPRPRILEPRNMIEPATTLENTEIALRIYRNISESDVSLYYYRGFYRRPFFLPDKIPAPSKIDYYHPKLSVFGASMQKQALGGIISLEGGFYDSRQDRAGTEPEIPNQTSRFLIGYQRQLWEDFTAGVQYYTEYKHDYKEYKYNQQQRAWSCPLEKKVQSLATLRLTHLFMHQSLKLSFFAFWSTTYKDYMIIPEIKYNFSDRIWAAFGANIFGGGTIDQFTRRGTVWTPFGSLDDNDNLYVQVRYEF